MARAYSIDLRERVLKYLEKNHEKMEASRLFCVGIATVYRWVRQKKEKGHVASRKRKYAYKKIKDDELRKYVETHPDRFLAEIAEEFSVTPQAIFYPFKRLKITRKKRQLFTGKEMMKREKYFWKI
jgi:transposase